jgi:hypothetical protein
VTPLLSTSHYPASMKATLIINQMKLQKWNFSNLIMELELLNSILSLGPSRQGEDSQFNASLNIFFLQEEMKISDFISHIPSLKSHLQRSVKGTLALKKVIKASGSGSSRAKMTHKKRKKVKNFMF